MTQLKTTQLPLTVGSDRKGEARTQFAALPYRIKKGGPEVLLVTSRRTGRWIVPKGWPMDGKTPAETAAVEAWEEAGITGKAHDFCLGLYSYSKSLNDEADLPCIVAVFPIEVKTIKTVYPEAKERKRKWFSLKKAAASVAEPELRQILQHFSPKLLNR